MKTGLEMSCMTVCVSLKQLSCAFKMTSDAKFYAISVLPHLLKKQTKPNHWGLVTFKEPQKLLTSKFFFETTESLALRFSSDGVGRSTP